MVITGGQSLLNFIGNDNIQNITSLRDCINQANKICGCQKQRKANKFEECDKIYVSIVNNTLYNLIEYLQTKTNDEEIIFYHHGHHQIKRIKLR